jgi:hypothetical protein
LRSRRERAFHSAVASGRLGGGHRRFPEGFGCDTQRKPRTEDLPMTDEMMNVRARRQAGSIAEFGKN